MIEVTFTIPNATVAKRISDAFVDKFPKDEADTDMEHFKKCIIRHVKRVVEEREFVAARKQITIDTEDIIS